MAALPRDRPRQGVRARKRVLVRTRRAPPARASPWITGLPALGVLSLLIACATFSNRGTVEDTVARATYRDIVVEVPDILGTSGFTLYRRQTNRRAIMFETDWRYRAPFDDEAEQGADAARTRLIVDARPSAGNVYAVRVRAENEVQGVLDATDPDEDADSWSTIPATDMYEAYARELFLRIRLRVDAGVRIR